MNSDVPTDKLASGLRDILAHTSGGSAWRRRVIAAGVVALIALLVLVAMLRLRPDSSAPRFHTATASVGTLVVKISATGNLQPTNEVEVGSELSGIVDRVFVDDNDRVKEGQLLAQLDVSRLEDARDKSRASLAAAEASVMQAQATVEETVATLERYRKVSELSGGKVPSRSEIDAAAANVKRANANAASARAGVEQARANLRSDETNLRKASIRSPIDGLVLVRDVEPGQTVAASFQAPVLFKLAEDLRKMELQVDVDEADVGQIKVGQSATFTVDAWPGRLYEAVISRVGYGSQEKDGVISYPSVLEVDNDDLSLRPGMTGTATITTLSRAGVLLVPNAALRFVPPNADATQARPASGITSMLMPRPPALEKKVPPTTAKGSNRVWLLRGGQPEPVDVTTGASDGTHTEITGGGLKAGMEVITEASTAAP
jgi:HlyD family secretion protein